mgnify:CR=1 FL=1
MKIIIHLSFVLLLIVYSLNASSSDKELTNKICTKSGMNKYRLVKVFKAINSEGSAIGCFKFKKNNWEDIVQVTVIKNKEILILEDFNLSNPNTSDYLNIIKSFGLEAKKTLVVTSEINNNIYLSSRNLKNSKVVINSELNTYEITDASNVLISESAVDGLESNLK